LGSLDDCVSYLDGTIYNIESKITNFEDVYADMMLLNGETDDSEQPLSEEMTKKLTISSRF
jgi:hypothetical protein